MSMNHTAIMFCVLLASPGLVLAESNDTPGGADTVVANGDWAATGLQSTSDVDWFKTSVSCSENQGELEWEADSLFGGPAIQLTVYLNQGQSSGSSQSVVIPATDNDSIFISVVNGTYYAKITCAGTLGNGYFRIRARLTCAEALPDIRVEPTAVTQNCTPALHNSPRLRGRS